MSGTRGGTTRLPRAQWLYYGQGAKEIVVISPFVRHLQTKTGIIGTTCTLCSKVIAFSSDPSALDVAERVHNCSFGHRRAERFEVRKSETATTVLCHGKLTCDTAPELRQVVKPLIPFTMQVTLDLSDVPYMDSTALGTVMSLYTSAVSSSSRVKLINLSPRTEHLLRMTNLISLLKAS